MIRHDIQAFGRNVIACDEGWTSSDEVIKRSTLAYNDAVMTWNGFIQSWNVQWFVWGAKPTPLKYVEWTIESSDPGNVKGR